MKKDIVLKVDHLSKEFNTFSSPLDLLLVLLLGTRKNSSRVRVLENVSFEVSRGAFVGLIGSNGAGKSTLLKILTGVQSVTSGEFSVKGEISSILELGVGFDPEKTGRENLSYLFDLHGIRGLGKDKRVEEASDFAGIGEFIERKVRTYSSGMFARLAFAYAVSVDPDILIVDEALSVGDIRFQQKCLRRMKEFKERGKTILFVSHDIASVREFCDTCIWLDSGRVRMQGDVKKVTTAYVHDMIHDDKSLASSSDSGVIRSSVATEETHSTNSVLAKSLDSKYINTSMLVSSGEKPVFIQGVSINGSIEMDGFYVPGEIYEVRLHLNNLIWKEFNNLIFGLTLSSSKGVDIFGVNTAEYVYKVEESSSGIFGIKFKFPNISSGDYILSVAVADGDMSSHKIIHWVHDVDILKVRSCMKGSELGQIFLSEQDVDFIQ